MKATTARAVADHAPRARRTSSVTSRVRIGAYAHGQAVVARPRAARARRWRRGRAEVTTISSPGSSVRATACASRKLSVVMFAPKAIPSGLAARELRGARPRSLHQLVGRPPRRGKGAAQVGVRVAAGSDDIAVDAPRSGTWEPPGPSRKAASPDESGKAGGAGRRRRARWRRAAGSRAHGHARPCERGHARDRLGHHGLGGRGRPAGACPATEQRHQRARRPEHRGAHPDGRDEAVDEGLRGAHAAARGEHGGQHRHAEHAADLADRVGGAGGLAGLLRADRAEHGVRRRARTPAPCPCRPSRSRARSARRPRPASVTSASQARPAAWSASPAAISGRLPMRSDRMPAIGATKIGIAVHGSVRMPASSGE